MKCIRAVNGRLPKKAAAIVLWALLPLLSVGGLTSAAEESDTLDRVVYIESPTYKQLATALHFFPAQNMGWQEVASLPLSQGRQAATFFISADQYKLPVWMRFDIATGSIAAEDKWLFGLGSGFPGDVEVFLVSEGDLLEHYKISSDDKFSSWPHPNRFAHFPLSLPSNTTLQVLTKIEYAPVPHYTPTITTQKILDSIDLTWRGWGGFSLGFLFALAAYHLFLSFSIRDRAYLYYGLQMLGSMCWFFYQQGISFKYFLPNNPWLQDQISLIIIYLPILAAYPFMIHFLGLNSLSTRLVKVLYGLNGLLVVMIVLKRLIPSFDIGIMSFYVIFSFLVFIGVGFYALHRGVVHAKYYLIAWSVYGFSAINMMMYVAGLPAPIEENGYLLQSASFYFQALFLAFALAHRIRKMRESKLQAESDNKAKSEFLARMSHEIRTPLSGVLGMAELLADRLKDKTSLYYVNIIRSSGSSLLTIINDILDYSKFSSGKIELEKIPFNIQRLAVDSLDVFKVNAADKGIELIADIDLELPSILIGDPTRVKQVMLNFISNAVKFTEQGQIVLKVSKDSQSEGLIRIAVIDSGPGIPAASQAKLFDAFSQASNATARIHGGTGLGLSICKQLADAMGGNIGVESIPGKGSTFWVTAQLEYGKQSVTSSQGHHDLTLEGKRILVVEDNYTFSELLVVQAETWGMDVERAKDGIEALDMLEASYAAGKSFDLISLDLVMPGMDGVETSSKINHDERFRGIPRVLLTSAINYPPQNELAAAGINKVMEKPALPGDLQQAYKSILAHTVSGNNVAFLVNQPADTDIPQLTILVAEDNPVNQVVVRGILKKLNQQVILVEDGLLAVDALKSNPEKFDLVLMDFDMPNMDGPTATTEIRRWEREDNLPPIPIVALTAHAVRSHIDACFEAGMNEYLAKPIDIEKLEQLLRAYPTKYPRAKPSPAATS
ncbi:hybrid sensor histidine kinase/response regulator [Aurantivibrio plasticivorans]